MATKRYIFTSESVTEGHPDKVADAISDAILDAHLAGDRLSRVACETLVSTGMAVVAGEITSRVKVPYADVVRQTIKRIGYAGVEYGFGFDTCAVLVSLDRQSPDIAQGVDARKAAGKATAEQGAGDQGMMFGYACRDTKELMPAPIIFAHRITRQLAKVRRSGELPFVRPDGKSQVSVVYEDGRPLRVDTVVVSTQHDPSVAHQKLARAIIEAVVRPSIPARLLGRGTRYFVNPTGRFVVGGPQGDAGVTGRKIIVDTYGGMGRHGGGCFSGKDPSKVDRSAAYMARYVAKNVVAADLADRCEIQLAYAIGYPEPVSVLVDTFGTARVPEKKIEAAVRRVFGFKPAEIISHLKLLRPIYSATTNYGHFGRTQGLDIFTWERTDKVRQLKGAL
jgi:S-adenosylmethionine synthetase